MEEDEIFINKKVRDALIEELQCQTLYEKTQKDIIILVRDQLNYTQKCLETLYTNTENFNLYLWDNGSKADTRDFLENFAQTHDNVILERSKKNLGFIRPNNKMAEKTTSPYIILLNNDTELNKGWDTALISWLQQHPNCAATGYLGGMLDENLEGGKSWYGGDIDYVCGWCLCIPQHIYKSHGLFDENHLEFAYCEDSDFCLRLKEASYQIYALHLNLVLHHGNKTIEAVSKEKDVIATFKRNHEYIRKRWSKYLQKHGVLLKNIEKLVCLR